jgi:hypothetical protein
LKERKYFAILDRIRNEPFTVDPEHQPQHRCKVTVKQDLLRREIMRRLIRTLDVR